MFKQILKTVMVDFNHKMRSQEMSLFGYNRNEREQFLLINGVFDSSAQALGLGRQLASLDALALPQ